MTDRPVLLLGGTAEAYALAEALVARGVPVVTSLAGRTVGPRRPAGDLRVGGFGGIAGLRTWLRRHRPAAVVDATHPFATAISAHAAAACAAEGVPRLALVRPAWPWDPAWHRAADTTEAARRLPALGRHALLTLGAGDLPAFAAVRGVALTARLVTPPTTPPPGIDLIVARGPFTLEAETALLRAGGYDVLVTKASGGAVTAPKLAAARALGTAVLVIDRPPPPPPPRAATVTAAVEWLDSAGCLGP